MIWYMPHRIFRWLLKLDPMCFDLWAFVGNVVACGETGLWWRLANTRTSPLVKHMQWSLVDLLPLQHWLACAFAVCLILCSLQIVHDDQNTPLNYPKNLVFLVPLDTARSLDDCSPSLPALSYHCIIPGFSILHPLSMRTLNSSENNHLGASDNWYSILKSPKIKCLNSWILSSCSLCIKTESRDVSICVAYD